MKTMTTTLGSCIPRGSLRNANEQAMVQLSEFPHDFFFAPSDTFQNWYAIRQLFQFCTHNLNAM